MPHDDDLQDLDDFIAYQLVTAPDSGDGGRGCVGCLAASLFLLGVLTLMGLAGRWLAP